MFDGLSQVTSFDELVQQGWFRTSWDRFSVPIDIARAFRQGEQNSDSVFKQLIDMQFSDALHLVDAFSPSGTLDEVTRSVVQGKIKLGEITRVSRQWIAARLWDWSSDASQGRNTVSKDARIGTWVDKWHLAKCPSFTMSSQLVQVPLADFIGSQP